MSCEIQFVSTRAFERLRRDVFTDKQLTMIKEKLVLAPDLGEMVQGTGGARKMRQRGSRGSSRLIYYYHGGGGRIYLLLCYPKADQEDLTPDQKAAIHETVRAIKDGETARAKERSKRDG